MSARWPLGVFFLALMPRLFELGKRPFWLDEVFTLQRASLPPAALVQDSFLNHHMPSFFLMLSPLIGLGDPQFWLRVPSALFGAASVMLVFIIASRIGGRIAGVVAALILGLSPTALAFSQEARSYTLEMCLILVALWGVVRLAMDVPASSRPAWRDGGALGAWVAFTVGSAAALDVLGDGLPWIITGNVIFLVLLPVSPNRGQLLRNLLLADGVIVLACLPFYLLMLAHQDKGFVSSVMWIPPLDVSRVWYDFGSVYFMRIADSVTFHFMHVSTPSVMVWMIDAALLGAVLAASWVLRRRPALLAALGISFVFLPLLFTVISIWRPILLPRYILWSAAPFAILAGIGSEAVLRSCAPRVRVVVMGVAALLLLTNMAPYYHVETKPRWDIAAAMLARDVRPGDVVYLYDTGALPILQTYLPAGAKTVVLRDAAGDLSHAMKAEAQGKRVWAVYGHAGQSPERQALAKFYGANRALGTPAKLQEAGKRIVIALYDPRRPPVACTAIAPAHLAGVCNEAMQGLD
ncbi:MAG: glycosyltransferase family 39 protein [Acidocella sp.]|nr:glycosyltransferase family 39 protein [Acidocella sp.]